MAEEKYPEAAKLAKAQTEYNAIAEFLENLGQLNLTLCEHAAGFWPTSRGITDILGQYFDIDLVKLEQERRQMLKEFTEQRTAMGQVITLDEITSEPETDSVVLTFKPEPHSRRTNIDWNREDPQAQPTMRSWTEEACYCKEPWSHH